MFTRACVSILASRTPLYTYTDMILTDVFPYDISYNSVGSIRFATDVIVVDSGADQRVSRWAQPLMEYDIAYGVRTMEQLSALIAFFRAMNGRLYTFMYQDHLDFTSSVATTYEARSAPPISATDQNIGTGDGTTTTFQLSKTYSSPSSGTTQVRPILCPNTTTVKVAINGVQVSNWTVNATTGIVTFTIPYQSTISGTVTKGAGSDDLCRDAERQRRHVQRVCALRRFWRRGQRLHELGQQHSRQPGRFDLLGLRRRQFDGRPVPRRLWAAGR